MQTREKTFKLKMKVQKTGHTFLPTEIRESGFEGEVDVLPNHFTALLVRPGASTEQVIQSLKAHLLHQQMIGIQL